MKDTILALQRTEVGSICESRFYQFKFRIGRDAGNTDSMPSTIEEARCYQYVLLREGLSLVVSRVVGLLRDAYGRITLALQNGQLGRTGDREISIIKDSPHHPQFSVRPKGESHTGKPPKRIRYCVSLPEVGGKQERSKPRSFRPDGEGHKDLPRARVTGPRVRSRRLGSHSPSRSFRPKGARHTGQPPERTQYTSSPMVVRNPDVITEADRRQKALEKRRAWAARVEAGERKRIEDLMVRRARKEKEQEERRQLWYSREMVAFQTTLISLAGILGVSSAEFIRTTNINPNYFVALAGIGLLTYLGRNVREHLKSSRG